MIKTIYSYLWMILQLTHYSTAHFEPRDPTSMDLEKGNQPPEITHTHSSKEHIPRKILWVMVPSTPQA